ncbi:MAG: type III secretion system export apparatus subunit SctU [Pseudomonadota bacterium]
MAGPTGEKTEQPTPKKLRDARAKGQVARSQEVVTTVSLMAVIAYIWVNAEAFFDDMVVIIDLMAALVVADDPTAIQKGMAAAFEQISDTLLPIIGVTILAAVAGNYLQIGSVFAIDGVMPKLEKIDPMAGFKRVFSKKQLFEVLKSLFKIIFLSVMLYFVIEGAIRPLILSVHCGMACLTSITVVMLATILGITAFAFIVVAVFDFWFQQQTHTKSLMMTKDEVKREYKESEGDPMIKGQRKQLAQELIMGDPVQKTKKSSAVVVNPVHLAVAIDYRPGETPLPIVMAKGRNVMAHAMREAAELEGVPIFHHKRLARSMYAEARVGEYVPDEFFELLAEVLTWVERNRDDLYKGPLDHGMIDLEGPRR